MNKALSIYLDLVRFLAALMVFNVHANANRFTDRLPVLWRFGDFGNDAVTIFFVLSGFVIAYVVDTKERTLADYASSRLARLYSIAVPALLLTMVLDSIGLMIAPAVYADSWFHASSPVLRFAANLFFVNQLWFLSIRPFSNVPYWSLGFEFWYYALFAAAVFARGRLRIVLLGAVALLIGPKILLLFPIWLAGVWAYSVQRRGRISLATGYCLFGGSLAAYAALRLFGGTRYLDQVVKDLLDWQFVESLKGAQQFLSGYAIGALMAANFLGAGVIAQRVGVIGHWIERPIRIAARYTFPLYLFHFPLLAFFSALSDRLGWGAFKQPMVVLGTLGVIGVLGPWAENTKSWWKRNALHLLSPSRAKDSPMKEGL